MNSGFGKKTPKVVVIEDESVARMVDQLFTANAVAKEATEEADKMKKGADVNGIHMPGIADHFAASGWMERYDVGGDKYTVKFDFGGKTLLTPVVGKSASRVSVEALLAHGVDPAVIAECTEQGNEYVQWRTEAKDKAEKVRK